MPSIHGTVRCNVRLSAIVLMTLGAILASQPSAPADAATHHTQGRHAPDRFTLQLADRRLAFSSAAARRRYVAKLIAGGHARDHRRLAHSAAAATTSVTLYEDINFGGASFTPADQQPDFRSVTFGCFLWWGCKNWNDRVSSLKVPAYTCVTLWQDISYGGPSKTWCGYNYSGAGHEIDYAFVGSDWNDRASSSSTYGQLQQP